MLIWDSSPLQNPSLKFTRKPIHNGVNGQQIGLDWYCCERQMFAKKKYEASPS